jgi:hypothetical protein
MKEFTIADLRLPNEAALCVFAVLCVFAQGINRQSPIGNREL